MPSSGLIVVVDRANWRATVGAADVRWMLSEEVSAYEMQPEVDRRQLLGRLETIQRHNSRSGRMERRRG